MHRMGFALNPGSPRPDRGDAKTVGTRAFETLYQVNKFLCRSIGRNADADMRGIATFPQTLDRRLCESFKLVLSDFPNPSDHPTTFLSPTNLFGDM